MTENKTVDEKPHTQPETALEHYWFDLGHNSNKIAQENEVLRKKVYELQSENDHFKRLDKQTMVKVLQPCEKCQYNENELRQLKIDNLKNKAGEW